MPVLTNPFPSSAVARYSTDQEDGPLTIVTGAVRRAQEVLDEYLKADTQTEERKTTGNVVAIVGEYGTGKTHLALSLIRRLRQSRSDVRSLYLDAPADNFLALYRERFIPRLRRSELRARVADYFSDIVADDLSGSEVTSALAAELRSRSVEPIQLVRRLGLMESRFQSLLVEKLEVVTDDQAFGTAMALFLRPEFEATVWEWLCGSTADPALKERGIVGSIDTDARALQAIGVVALLYGGQQHRFVLVFDEMEKVLGAGPYRGQTGVAPAALKELLEIAIQSGALLVLCGLPELLEALPDEVRSRISVIIQPTRLMGADAVRLIEDVNEHASGERTLSPFSEDVAQYLAQLSGGNARRLIRLCFYAFQTAATLDANVTRAIVREVAREQFELVSVEDLKSEVVRVLDRNGWSFEPDRPIEGGRHRVDYWIRVGDAACAILLAQSVLQETDAERLTAVARNLRSQQQPMQETSSLLIVNGYLSEEQEPLLQTRFDRVLVHRLRTFTDDLDSTLQAMVARLERQANEVSLSGVAERVDQLLRQNHRVSSTLDAVLSEISSRRALQGAVESGLVSVFSRLSGEVKPTRWNQVDQAFVQAMYLLDSCPTVADLFDRSGKHPDFDSEELTEPRMLSQALVGSILLREAVTGLRTTVTATLQHLDPDRGRVNRSDMDPVAEACRSYDSLLRIPSFRDALRYIDDLLKSPRMSTSRRVSRRLIPSQSAADYFEGLGHDVFNAMNDTVED